MKKVIIIGSGLSGLSCGYYLDKSKFSKKNTAIFVHPDTKITKFKGEFDG